MFRRLLDPFQSVALPETVEDVLEDFVARCIAFNRWGTLLAAGCEDGKVVVYDMETRGVARTFQPHTQAVTCLAWSRDGHFLASAAADSTLSLWRVLDNRQEASASLQSPAASLSLDRRDPKQAIASLAQGPPLLVDLGSGEMTPLPLIPADAEGRKGGRAEGAHAVALFSRDGRQIYVAQARGLLSVLERASRLFLDALRVGAAGHISALALSPRGNRLVANCSDRCARLLEVLPPAPGQPRFAPAEAAARIRTAKGGKGSGEPDQDAGAPALLRPLRAFAATQVDAQPWAALGFSHDMEHLAAATPAHAVYLYSLVGGALDKVLTLDGGKDALAGLAWHPGGAALATLGGSGRVYCWARVYRENWSAFAPDFTELAENQEYVEREDEFDINPREEGASHANGDASAAAAGAELDDDDGGDVDIVTGEAGEPAGDPFAEGVSSDEECMGDCGEAAGQLRRPLHHLPIEVQRQASPAPAVEEKPQPEPAVDMDDDVSLSGSDDGVAGNGHASAMQGEEGMGGLASRQMGYGDPPGQPSEEEPGSAGRRKRRPARSMSFDREPPRGPEPDGLGPRPGKTMRTSHVLPAGLDNLEIPDFGAF